jgi:hypothetical protein
MRTTALTGLVLAIAVSVPLAGLSPEQLAALDTLPGADIPVVMNFKDRPLGEVFRAIASAGPFKVTIEGDIENQRINADWGKQSLKAILVRLAEEYDLTLSVPQQAHLVVGKRAKSE